MGVMSCSRLCCDNIMCDMHINDVGYVCSDCQYEFKEYMETTDKNDLTEHEIKKELITFMSTEKNTYIKGDKMDVSTFFDKYR